MKIKCACGKPSCSIQIRFSGTPIELWITDFRGEKTLMYLDEKALRGLILAARSALNELEGENVDE